MDWYRRGEFPLLGLYIGHNEIRWTIEEILDSRQAFAAEFERHILMREPCYCKV